MNNISIENPLMTNKSGFGRKTIKKLFSSKLKTIPG